MSQVMMALTHHCLCHWGHWFFVKSTTIDRYSSINFISFQPTFSSPSVHHLTIDFSISGTWFLCQILWLLSTSQCPGFLIFCHNLSLPAFDHPSPLHSIRSLTMIYVWQHTFLTKSYYHHLSTAILSPLPMYHHCGLWTHSQWLPDCGVDRLRTLGLLLVIICCSFDTWPSRGWLVCLFWCKYHYQLP